MDTNKEDFQEIDSQVKGVKLYKVDKLPSKFLAENFGQLSPKSDYILVGACNVEARDQFPAWDGFLVENVATKRRFPVSLNVLLGFAMYKDQSQTDNDGNPGKWVQNKVPAMEFSVGSETIIEENCFVDARTVSENIGCTFKTSNQMHELLTQKFEDGQATDEILKRKFFGFKRVKKAPQIFVPKAKVVETTEA